jgi:curved DNA-binding protein CbpA
MDFKSACEILEIDPYSQRVNNITLEYLKKRYHKLALQNHPDKRGNTVEAKEKFQQINEAYNYLSREISNLDSDLETDFCNNEEKTEGNTGYINILNVFLDSLLKGHYNDFLSSFIKDIVNGYKDITMKMFEDLDKEKTLGVYNFLFKYKNILYISDEILDKVQKIIAEKYKDVQIYVLNPSINDLFSNNVYKLDLDGEKYFVPLWHNELYFDDKLVENGKDSIIVKCIPELPENISIDENNNIQILLTVSFTFSLLEQKSIVFYLGEKRVDLPLEDLKMQRFQTLVLRRQGISKVIDNDIYNVEERGDIIVRLFFCE